MKITQDVRDYAAKLNEGRGDGGDGEEIPRGRRPDLCAGAASRVTFNPYTSYRVINCQTGGDYDDLCGRPMSNGQWRSWQPYDGISFEATSTVEALEKAKEWVASEEVEVRDNSWLQVMKDGKSVASLKLGEL